MPPARTQPIVLVSRAARPKYGQDPGPVQLQLVQGVFAPRESEEDTDRRDQVTTLGVVYLPEADLTAVDAVVTDATVTEADGDTTVVTGADGWPAGGTRWEVDGDPKLWPAHPFSDWRPARPLEVHLREVRN